MVDIESRGRPLAYHAAMRWGPAAAGGALIVVAVLLAPQHAQEAAAQDWPPFVLVTGHPYVDVWQAVKPTALGIAA